MPARAPRGQQYAGGRTFYESWMMLNKITILLADDHQMVRSGLKQMLESQSSFTVVGEAASGEEALELAAQLKPDIVLMDMKMPGIGGLEATSRMERRAPSARVIALTACADDPYPNMMLKAGAKAFVTKESGMDELVQAVREVHAGRHYICRSIAQEIALKPLRNQADSPFSALSEREMQVALMIVGGTGAQEIADKLNVSPKTVNTYRYRMFDKLGVDSDVSLTLLALRHKLFALDGDN